MHANSTNPSPIIYTLIIQTNQTKQNPDLLLANVNKNTTTKENKNKQQKRFGLVAKENR